MKGPERRYWDSSVFLAGIKQEEGRNETVRGILRLAANGDCIILTSAVTLAEVVRPHKGTKALTPEDEAEIVEFFKNPFIQIVDYTEPLGLASRKLQWNYGLKVRDSIHAASAIYAKAAFLEAYDGDFGRIKREDIPDCPEVREPKLPQPGLFDGS